MRKHNSKMRNNAERRADKRFAGGQKILKFLSRGAAIDSGSYGMHRLQQTYGI